MKFSILEGVMTSLATCLSTPAPVSAHVLPCEGSPGLPIPRHTPTNEAPVHLHTHCSPPPPTLMEDSLLRHRQGPPTSLPGQHRVLAVTYRHTPRPCLHRLRPRSPHFSGPGSRRRRSGSEKPTRSSDWPAARHVTTFCLGGMNSNQRQPPPVKHQHVTVMEGRGRGVKGRGSAE